MDSAHVSIQQLLNCFQSEGEQDMFEANNYVNAKIIKRKRNVIGREVDRDFNTSHNSVRI